MKNEKEIQQVDLQATPVEVKAQEKTVVQKKNDYVKVILITVVSTVAVIALLLGMIWLVLTGAGMIGNTPKETDPAVTEPVVTEPVETQSVPDHSYTVDDATAVAKSGDVVATAGAAQLTNADLQVYYEGNILAYNNQYGYYLMMMGIDLSQALDTMWYDETSNLTWQDIMLDSALQNWYIYVAVRQYADAEGFVLDEEGQEYLANLDNKMQEIAAASNCETVEQMVTGQIAPAATVEAYRKYMEADYYYGRYVDYLEEKYTPTTEEIEQYYTENEAALTEQGISKESGDVVDIRHVLIMPEGGTTDENNKTVYSDEEWEACRKKAQELYDAWLAGEATEETFIQMAKEHSKDGNASTGGIYENVTKDYMVEEFDAWIFDESREYGNHGLVKTQYGYHIMFFVDREAEWVRKTSNYMMSESINNIIKAAMEAYPLEKNLDAVILSR